MPDWDEQPSAVRWLRWPLRTLGHMVEGWALWADGVALLLFLAPRAQDVASLFGFAPPSWLTTASTGVVSQLSPALASLIATAIVLQAVARAGIDEEIFRARPSPEHVRDLQQQAAYWSRNIVLRPGAYVQIDPQSSVLATYYCQHFPEVAAQIQRWNGDVTAWQSVVKALHRRIDRDSSRSIEGQNVTIAGVLYGVCMGSYSSPRDVEWSVQQFVGPVHTGTGLGVSNLAFQDGPTNQSITVSTIPHGVDALLFASGIQSWLNEARDWSESVEYRQGLERIEHTRTALSRQFEATRLNYTPGGTCDACRAVKS